MHRVFEAVYEHGVLRPLEPVNLRDRQHVQVSIKSIPDAGSDVSAYFEPEEWESSKHDDVTLEEVRSALASIPGSLADDVIASREDRS